MTTLRVAVRDWDYLTPLLLGEVDLSGFERLGVNLAVERVSPLVPYGAEDFDVAELSMAQYWLARGRGDDRVTAVPHLMMRGFRHRCVVVNRESNYTMAADLKGLSIGLTGWPDSGNTWTRAALVDDGLPIDSVRWVPGRLTEDHPVQDRLQGYGVPGHIEADPQERPLVEMLGSGELAAVLTPFMPPGYFDGGSPWRPLYPDLVQAEGEWFFRRGHVPGMHVLGWRTERLRPDLAHLVSKALDDSWVIWDGKRKRYADTTPWLFPALRQGAVLGDWNAQGLEANRAMFTDFGHQLVDQGIASSVPELDDLFPIDIQENS
ncbi:hypothetical protein GCM10027418_26490 [Mariniluteicoccus endophyticus]